MNGALYSSALLAIGGTDGGTILPRWFGALPRLGIREAYLFWAVPNQADVSAPLDQLAADAKRWSAQLDSLGIRSELCLKRGVPGPWLTALAGIYHADLIVLGAPIQPKSRAETLSYLLDNLKRPLLVLPGGDSPADPNLLSRALIDRSSSEEGRQHIQLLAEHAGEVRELDVTAFGTGRAARAAAKLATDIGASIIVLAQSAREIAGPLAQFAGLPLLILPEPRPMSRRVGRE